MSENQLVVFSIHGNQSCPCLPVMGFNKALSVEVEINEVDYDKDDFLSY